MPPLKNYFSVESAARKLLSTAKRFPISVAFLLVLAARISVDVAIIWGAGAAHIIDLDFIKVTLFCGGLYPFLTTGAIIGAAATLWLEDAVSYIKRHLITAGVMLLWGVYHFFSLPGLDADVSRGYVLNKISEVCAIGAVSFSAIFFICFLKRGKDKAFWNFAARTLFQYALASVFGGVIYIGLSGALSAVYGLFDIAWSGRNVMYAHFATFCSVLFTPIYFLANIPDKSAKYDENIRQNKTLKIFALYVLAPLAAIYAIILYIYLFKIIFSWELPQGLVSWLVSALACAGLLIITLLYPTHALEKNKIVDFVSLWSGVIILPLLVLMSIGIFRRVSDYGITIMRLYLIIANLWFYGIYAHIFITKARRIKWILISVAALILLTSIGPLNIPNVTKYMLTAKVERLLGGKKIPTSDKEYSNYKYHVDFEDMIADGKYRDIADAIIYLRDTYGDESIKRFYIDVIWFDDILGDEDESESGKKPRSDPKASFSFEDGVAKAYSVKEFDSFYPIIYARYNTCRWSICGRVENNQFIISVDREFSVPMREAALRLVQSENMEREELVVRGDDYMLLIQKFKGVYDTEADTVSINTVEGYLFYNKENKK